MHLKHENIERINLLILVPLRNVPDFDPSEPEPVPPYVENVRKDFIYLFIIVCRAALLFWLTNGLVDKGGLLGLLRASSCVHCPS